MLKKIFGFNSTLESDGSYSPSKMSLKLATANKTDFENIAYQKYQGEKSKILIILTEDKNMGMANGTFFSTGNHPVETLLPMLHLKNAGFEFEIATPTGKPVVFEMWAFPQNDKYVQSIFEEYNNSFMKPISLEAEVNQLLNKTESYAAVFIPGGHGALLGLPEDKNVAKVLNWAFKNDLYIISLCHGPGAFLSTALNHQKFIFDGYQMAVFPDSVDRMTPKIGYLPGKMPYALNERLISLGAKIVNTKSDKTVCIDRRLITGASPLASNELGKLAVTTLLNNL